MLYKIRGFFYVIFIIIYFSGFFLRLIALNIFEPTVSIFNILNKNIKLYYKPRLDERYIKSGDESQGSSKLTLHPITPFFTGIFFGIYYFENRYKILNKKNSGKILVYSIILIISMFTFQYLINLDILDRNINYIVIISYIFKIFKYDFFSYGILCVIIYLFINSKSMGKILWLFNNSLFLFLKKISLVSYLIFAIIAKIFFYSFETVLNIKGAKIFEYLYFGIPINLIISSFIYILFIMPVERICLIIKSTYIKKNK